MAISVWENSINHYNLSIHKHLLSVYCVLGPVLDTGDSKDKNIETIFALKKVIVLGRKNI